jgi:LysR family glycine cleavage system transcriptional activator
MMLPSLKALRALSTIAAEGSFERAAERLGVSRSAVSHLIGDLEHQLGVRLLDRGRRGVTVTEDGLALLDSMGDAIRRIEAAIEAFRRDRNQIRLSTVATFASSWLIPRLPDLQAQHPHIQLSILTTNRAVDYSTEDFDCGIRHGVGPWPGLECTLLFREALVLVGLPALIHKKRHDNVAAFVRSVPIIQARTRPHDLSQWWQGAGLGGKVPRPSLIVENRAQAVAAALAGSGVTLIHPKFVETPGPMSALAMLQGKTVPLPEGYFFVVPERNRGRRNVNLLASWLASEAAKAAAGPVQRVPA